MADTEYFEIPADLPSGDAGVKIRALSRTVAGTAEKVGVTVIVDPTDPTIEADVDATYGLAVDVKRSALPSGAATSAAQTTGNASLSSIDGKLPALGQALADGSLPVVLTAAQISALTPPAAITGFATEASISPATSANNQGSTVSIPASNTLALAAFSTRKGGTIYAPDSNAQIVYISLGGTATSSGIPLSPGASMPLNQGSGAYAGAVNGLSASGTQALIVVEW